MTSFVGRRNEIAEAKRLLSLSRLLTLTGVSGVGKTRLAVRVAGQVSRAFPDGAWLVPLAGLTDDALVPHAVADVLGIRDETGRATLDVLVEHLRERRLLLVLDNCEHLLNACARFTHEILLSAMGVRVLATSQHRLGPVGEQLMHLAPLRVPTPEELPPNVSADTMFPAMELFADRAAAAVPGFAITATNQAAVARLCRRLDGLPLAIELASVRTRYLSVEQIAERLDDRFRLLTGGSRTQLPRHQTLRSAVDWSYELCTPVEQLVWARISVFADSCDLRAAEAVCTEDDPEQLIDVLDAIAGLVDKSVLVSEHAENTVRYRLLSSLRDYGQEKLNELGEASSARRRHRDHYLRLAKEYEKQWFGPHQAEIAADLRAERDNFRAALEFCLSSPAEAQHGLRLAGTLWCYWVSSGAWGEARHWIHQAIRAGAKPSSVMSKPHWVGGALVLIHSRSAAVLRAGARPAPAPPLEAPVVTPLAAHLPQPQHGQGELIGFVVLDRVELACTFVFHGRPERALPLCAEVLAVCEANQEQWARSYALRTLAMAHWLLGEHESATTHARECLRLKYVRHEPHGLGMTLELLAAIAASVGDAERGAVLQGAADSIWHDIGRSPLEAQQLVQGRTGAGELLARKALGNSGFEKAFRRGRALSSDEAVTYALQDRSELPGGGTPKLPGGGTPKRAATSTTLGELTPRERQVAELVAQGLSDKQIAETLVISQRTAEGHVQRVLVKLGFTNRTQLAAWFSSKQAPDEQPGSP